MKADDEKVKKKLEGLLKKIQGEAPAGTEDSTLTRSTGDAAQEKYRCTYEARHVILKYADPEAAAPEALNWNGALVVKASVHARLQVLLNGKPPQK